MKMHFFTKLYLVLNCVLLGLPLASQAEQSISLAPSVSEVVMLSDSSIDQTVTMNQNDLPATSYTVEFVVPEECACTLTTTTPTFTITDAYTLTYTIQTKAEAVPGDYAIQVKLLQNNPQIMTDGSSVQFGITHQLDLTITTDTVLASAILSGNTLTTVDENIKIEIQSPARWILPDQLLPPTLTITSQHTQRIQYLPYQLTVRHNGQVLSNRTSTLSQVIQPGENTAVLELPITGELNPGFYSMEITMNGTTTTHWWIVYSIPLLIECLLVVIGLVGAYLLILRLSQRHQRTRN